MAQKIESNVDGLTRVDLTAWAADAFTFVDPSSTKTVHFGGPIGIGRPLVAIEADGSSGGSVSSAPDWGTWNFGDGTVGLAYSHQWDMVFPNRPISYSLDSGTIPPGLSLVASGDGHSARISGTPTIPGTYSFTLRATNSIGSATHAFSITIAAASGGGEFSRVFAA